MNRYAIIVAGGTGVRMGSSIPKQFMSLGNVPMLMYSVRAFHNAGIENIIVVIAPNFIDYWKSLCELHAFGIQHKIVGGGLFRSQSVRHGLAMINDNDALVAIHDGVRPFVSIESIHTAFRIAEENGSAVPYLDLTDSIRQIDDKHNKHLNRDKYKIIQTPQCFKYSLLKLAYGKQMLPSFTDDAAVVEQLGVEITLFKGNQENIKITTPLDMLVAESILKIRQTI